jgi:hypothetical protein
MKTIRIKFVAILPALFLLTATIWAQTTAFNYQGKLTDNGTPQAIYQMEFRLFGSPGGTDQIGATVTNTSVAVNQGVFTVNLDFGAPAFPGADRFLQISVRRSTNESFVTLNPRQQITSSPYSIRTLSAAQADLALDSQKLGGVPASDYVTTASVGSSFIKNATTQQTGANFNIAGNGIVGGKLGVGIDAGSLKFSVNGQAGIRPRGTDESFIGFLSNVAGNVPTVSLSTSDGSQAEMRLQGGALKLATGFGFGTPTNGITVARSGNVGISTDTPNAGLEIVRDWDGQYGALALRGNKPSIRFSGGADSANQQWLLHQGSSGSMQFFNGGTTGNFGEAKMSLSPNGNVGIGTSVPNARLSLFGGTAWTSNGWTGSLSMGNGGALGWETNASGQRFGIGQSTGGLYFFRTTSAFGATGSPANYDVTIADSGNVGIGTLTPRARLDVAGNAVQDRSSGGLVKAMIHIDRAGGIARCYNGMIGSSTGNCGFTVTRISSGIYRISFGFSVSDRFISITPEYATTCNVVGSTCKNAGANFRFFGTDLEVFTFQANDSDNTSDAASMTIVY